MTASTDGVDTVTITSNAAADVDDDDLRRRPGERQRQPRRCRRWRCHGRGVRGGRRGRRRGHREPRRRDPAGLPRPGRRPRSTWRTPRPTRSPAARRATSCTPTASDDVSTGLGDDWVEGAGSVSGGEGDDTLRQISGSVQGGPGDDLIVTPGPVRIDGGSGFDTVVVDYSIFTDRAGRRRWHHRREHQRRRSPPPASRRTTSRRPTAARAGQRRQPVLQRPGRASTAAPATTPSWADRARTWPTSVSATTWSTPAPAPTSSWVATVTTRSRPATASATWSSAARATTRSPPTGPTCSAAARTSPCRRPRPAGSTGPTKVTKGAKAFFTFAASVASATFECQIDTGAFKPCSSPFKVKTKKLKTGKHTLTVRAVQPAGNADPTPSTFKFKVRREEVRR